MILRAKPIAKVHGQTAPAYPSLAAGAVQAAGAIGASFGIFAQQAREYVIAQRLGVAGWLTVACILSLQVDNYHSFELGTVADITILATDVLFFALLVVLGFARKGLISEKGRPLGFRLPLVFFLGAVTASEIGAYFSFGLEQALSTSVAFLKVAEYFVLYLAVSRLVNTPERADQLIKLLIFLATIQALVGIYRFSVASGTVGWFAEHRASGLIATLWSYGTYLAIAIILFSATWATTWRTFVLPHELTFRFCNLLLLFAALAVSGSRAAWLGLLVAVAFGLLLVRKEERFGPLATSLRLRGWTLVVMATAALAAFALFVQHVVIRATKLFAPFATGQSVSISDRLLLWLVALYVWKEHLWLGVGWSGYRFLAPEAQREATPVFRSFFPSGPLTPVSDSAHNQYLQTATDLGVIGLAAFLWLVIAVLRGTWRVYRSTGDAYLRRLTLAILQCFVCLGVSLFFSSLFGGDPVVGYIAILVGLLAAIWRMEAGSPFAEAGGKSAPVFSSIHPGAEVSEREELWRDARPATATAQRRQDAGVQMREEPPGVTTGIVRTSVGLSVVAIGVGLMAAVGLLIWSKWQPPGAQGGPGSPVNMAAPDPGNLDGGLIVGPDFPHPVYRLPGVWPSTGTIELRLRVLEFTGFSILFSTTNRYYIERNTGINYLSLYFYGVEPKKWVNIYARAGGPAGELCTVSWTLKPVSAYVNRDLDLALVYGHGKLALYVDGKPSSARKGCILPAELESDFAVAGANDGGPSLSSVLDELRISRGMRARREVQATFGQRRFPRDSGTIFLEHFDKPTASRVSQ